MFSRKFYISKQKNNRVFVQFVSLYDILSTTNQNKIINIANLFSKEFFVKLTSKNINDIQSILRYFENVGYLNDLKKDEYQFALQLNNEQVAKLIKLVDYEEMSLELYACNDKMQLKDVLQSEMNTDFYMYLLDNDGPFILFNKKLYDYKETVNKIKTILDK